MKPNDVRRGIASRHVRTGSAPDIGRVSRLRGSHSPQAGDPDRVRRRGSRKSVASQRTHHFWSIAFGVAAFAILVTVIALWLQSFFATETGPTGATVENQESSVKIASKFPSPTREEAIDIVKEALNNRDLAKIDILFRHGNSTSSDIMDYCSKATVRDGTLDSYDWMSSLDIDGLLIEGVLVNYKGKERTNQRLALLTPDDRGRWQVDFDAFARTVTPSWSDLLGGAGELARVRVIAIPGVYYNGIFRDESAWSCYFLTSPDTDVTLCGYCRTGSRDDISMKQLFAEGAANARVTLELRRIKDAEPRQFEIARILSREWVVPDESGKTEK